MITFAPKGYRLACCTMGPGGPLLQSFCQVFHTCVQFQVLLVTGVTAELRGASGSASVQQL